MATAQRIQWIKLCKVKTGHSSTQFHHLRIWKKLSHISHKMKTQQNARWNEPSVSEATFGPGSGYRALSTLFFLLLFLLLILLSKVLRLFHFITDRRQTSHADNSWQHYPQSHRDGFLPCDALRCTVFVIVILSVRLSVCRSVRLSHS